MDQRSRSPRGFRLDLGSPLRGGQESGSCTHVLGQMTVSPCWSPKLISFTSSWVLADRNKSKNHSVVQGDPDSPCEPSDGGFYSGYILSSSGVAPTSFSVLINDTNPIYYYW